MVYIVLPSSLSGHFVKIGHVAVSNCKPIVPRALLLMCFFLDEKFFQRSFQIVDFLGTMWVILCFKANIKPVMVALMSFDRFPPLVLAHLSRLFARVFSWPWRAVHLGMEFQRILIVSL